ncbi:MAG TPA: aminotransferase class IV [Anaerolineales bacterium]|nr:aminotransferase class IV [Anaerolineales bacterium]
MALEGFRVTSSGLIPLDITASTLDGITVLLADGFYTTFSTLAGGTRVLGLQAHLDRLYVPARDLGLKPSADETTLRRHIADLAQQNLPDESRLRLILTKNTGDVFLGIQPFIPPPRDVYENGVHVVTANISRRDPRIKGTDFITQSTEQRKRVGGDVFEILLTKNGGVLEGMTSNFYVITHVIASRQAKQSQPSNRGLLRPFGTRNDIKLITARHGILLGVTRKAVLRLARGEGMQVEYRAPPLDEDFDEAFITSSSRGVVPIVKIDDKPVGEGKVGAWTKTLSSAYQAYVRERSEKIV